MRSHSPSGSSDLAEALQHLTDHPLSLTLVRDVGANELGTSAALGYRLSSGLPPLFIQGGDDHVRALIG
jgi:hypothetical protein